MPSNLLAPTRRTLLQYAMMLPLAACGDGEGRSENEGMSNDHIFVANDRALDGVRVAYANAQWEPLFINWVGDSLTAGQTSETIGDDIDNARASHESAPGQLGMLFANAFGITPGGVISPVFTGKDSRVVSSGTRAATTTGPLGMVARASMARNSRLQIDCPESNHIDILFYNNNKDPNTGSFSFTVDGSAQIQVPLSGPFKSNKVKSWVGTSIAPHRVTLTSTDSSNENLWQGIRFHNGKGVVVSRYGRPGWTSSDMLGIGKLNGGVDEKGKERLAIGLAAGNPQLVIIAIGHNDWARQKSDGTNPETYAANLDFMVKTLTERGHAVLLLSTPLPPTVTGEGESLSEYWRVARTMTEKHNLCAHANLADVINPGGNVSRALELGLYAGPNTVHASRKGYAVIASIVHSIITSDLVLNT